MNNKRAIFNIIYKATGVAIAPCDIDEIITLAKSYENGTEGPVRESGTDTDGRETVAP